MVEWILTRENLNYSIHFNFYSSILDVFVIIKEFPVRWCDAKMKTGWEENLMKEKKIY